MNLDGTWLGTQSNAEQMALTVSGTRVTIRVYYRTTGCSGYTEWSSNSLSLTTGYFSSSLSGCPFSGTVSGTLSANGTGSGNVALDYGSGCTIGCATSPHTTYTVTRQ